MAYLHVIYFCKGFVAGNLLPQFFFKNIFFLCKNASHNVMSCQKLVSSLGAKMHSRISVHCNSTNGNSFVVYWNKFSSYHTYFVILLHDPIALLSLWTHNHANFLILHGISRIIKWLIWGYKIYLCLVTQCELLWTWT